MGPILFDLFPQFFNGVVIGRVGRQLVDCQSLFMFFEELLHGFTGMITGSVLDQDNVLLRLIEDGSKKLSIAFGGQPGVLSLVEESSSETVYQPKDLVPFSDP